MSVDFDPRIWRKLGMRSAFLVLVALSLFAGTAGVCVSARAETAPAAPANYDSDLAEELGADEYGMRSYIFCLLKTGSAKIDDPELRSEIFRGHFASMAELAGEGLLVLAGPFSEAEPWRGMYVFAVPTIEEAEQLVKRDPAVQAGIFDYELKRFYGSAALMQIGEIHSKIQKSAIE